jgi:hypothetical protein
MAHDDLYTLGVIILAIAGVIIAAWYLKRHW